MVGNIFENSIQISPVSLNDYNIKSTMLVMIIVAILKKEIVAMVVGSNNNFNSLATPPPADVALAIQSVNGNDYDDDFDLNDDDSSFGDGDDFDLNDDGSGFGDSEGWHLAVEIVTYLQRER